MRLHIQRTNEMLEGLAHISYARKQGGYVLSVINEEGFSEWLDRMHRFGDLDGSASEKRIVDDRSFEVMMQEIAHGEERS